MGYIKLKFDIPTFSRNGRKKVNGMVQFHQGGGMPHNPVYPGGNFPTCGKPEFAKPGG